MSAYEPNATAVRLTMEERNLHRMLQERTDELGLVRRELHEWKTRAESAERERDELSARLASLELGVGKDGWPEVQP